MSFGTDFLPTPSYLEAFKLFLQQKYSEKDNKVIMQHLDLLSLIKHEFAVSGFSAEDAEIWLQNAMSFPGWGELYSSAQAFLDVINEWMDAVEENSAISQEAGVPSQAELKETADKISVLEFQGSPKQVAWAKKIALEKVTQIHMAIAKGAKIPTAAKWWIENRDTNLLVSLQDQA